MSAHLRSWKEIAAFLGVSVRTAQNWEREYGLPVYRIPGARGQVTADPERLNQWRAETFLSTEAETASEALPETNEDTEILAPPGEDPPKNLTPQISAAAGRRSYALWFTAFVVLTAAWFGCWWFLQRPLALGSVRVEDRVLVVLDENGREAWRHTFPVGLDTLYARMLQDSHRRRWVFADLDRDGVSELVFVVAPAEHESPLHAVVAFSNRGKLLWRFVPGQTVRTAQESFAPPFTIDQIGLGKVDGKLVIGVVSMHNTWYPLQVALLSPEGKLLKEYWHSGDLPQLEFVDLDGDGSDELAMSGVNNARAQATLIILDPRTMKGASAEPPGYQLQGLGAGVERARIFFPRSCVARGSAAPYNAAQRLFVRPSGFQVELAEVPYVPATPYLHYKLSRDLQLLQVAATDEYVAAHNRLYLDRRLDHRYTPAELNQLQLSGDGRRTPVASKMKRDTN